MNGEHPKSDARTSNPGARPQQRAGMSLADFYADLAHWCGLDWPEYSMHEAAHEAVEALADAKEEIERPPVGAAERIVNSLGYVISWLSNGCEVKHAIAELKSICDWARHQLTRISE